MILVCIHLNDLHSLVESGAVGVIVYPGIIRQYTGHGSDPDFSLTSEPLSLTSQGKLLNNFFPSQRRSVQELQVSIPAHKM